MVGACVRRCAGLIALTIGCVLASDRAAQAQTRETIVIRGHPQSLRLYGTRGGSPVIVSSGDGGWVHLAPHVAEALAANGFFVAGFDVKAYLESFTSGSLTLGRDDEPGDYKTLADFTARGSAQKPILIGASEGAGLSLLAATDPQTKRSIAGVLGLGLPDLNELGWRWKDSLIYITHGVPKEPIFSTVAIAGRVSPTPLAAIHSTQDEFVAVSVVRQVLDAAAEPKKLWIVKASDHRFSDNLAEFDRRVLEAIAWINQHAAP
jgi:hypothetical protein